YRGPLQKSLRWDGGSGQAVIRDVAFDHALVDWPTCPLYEPHQATALRRSRTEAGSSDRITQKGIDLSRPVTEARIERQRNPGPALPHFTSFNAGYEPARLSLWP